MLETIVDWSWIGLFLVISIIRKWHEHRADQPVSLKDTPVLEATLMLLWGLAAGVAPFIYIFSRWFDFADYPFTLPFFVRVIGILLFMLAIWLLHRSHVDLGKSWSSRVEPDSDRLVTDGIYTHIRHPMYLAHVVWGISQALLFPNFLAGISSLLLIALLLYLRIPREEQAMIQQFGDRYQQYRERTGYIFPRLR